MSANNNDWAGTENHVRYPDEQIVEMRKMFIEGASLREVSRKFGIDPEHARNIKLNRNRAGIGPDASQAKYIPGRIRRQAQVQSLLDSGCAANEIAAQLSLKLSTVHAYIRLCTNSPAKLRARKQARVAAAIRLRCEGLTQVEIAQRLNVAQRTVSQWLKQAASS